MPAIALSADGAYLFLALEDGDGDQIIAKADVTALSTWTAVYEPGAGSAANIMTVPSDPDKMLFYGNFDTDVVLVEHTISGPTNTDISPASLGAAVANAAAVNPSNADEIIITVNDPEQDIEYTSDGGANWEVWDAVGFDPTALAALWSGAYDYHRYFVTGQLIGSAQLLYSPNAGYSVYDYTGLMAVADALSLEATEQKTL